jgi:zinc protease
MPSRLASLAAALLVVGAPAAHAEPESLTLDNGLNVLLRPAPGARQAALVVLYSIGGDHDPRGRSGLAHLVEHMYVTAAAGKTKARAVEEYAKLYPKGWNAQTGDRYTVFATCFADTDLERELQDAAARMGDLRVAASDLDREKPRIEAELANMFGRLPHLGAMNHARELARPTPLGGRKGGASEHVRAATLEEVKARWRRYYKPRNALLVLAGGFDAAAARKSIESHFGKLPAGEPAPAPAEPAKANPGPVRTFRVKPLAPHLGPEACLAFAAPAPGGDLYPAYLVLVARLQADARKLTMPAGRFPVHCPLLDDPAALYVGTPADKGETADQAVQRLTAFVADAVKPPLGGSDVANVRAMFGPMLGLGEVPDAVAAANPYFSAFSLGRQRQLVTKPAELNAALTKLRDEDLRRAAKEVFGAGRAGAAFVSPGAK